MTKPAKKIENKDEEIRKAKQLPVPKGYKLLIALPEIEETTKGGIIKASQTMRVEEVGSICGFVINMGQDCYKDEKRFPNGPYCKEGDFVIFRSYSGTRFKFKGEEFRLINDDTVEAVVDDPRGYTRA